MVEFDKTIGKSEETYYYLNLTDNDAKRYGTRFPADRTKLWIITNGRRYKASKRGENQIWGVLKLWYEREKVRSGDAIHIRYDPNVSVMEGRVPIAISITKRGERIDEVPAEEGTAIAEEPPAIVSVQMESELEDFLINNLELLEDGLKLYVDDTGRHGRHYPTDVGIIDLLCKNRDDFVVVELKKGRASDAVVGQISRYIGWIKENLADDHDARGIVVVHDFDPKLKYAVLAHNNIELKYYEIQIKFVSEQQIMEKLERKTPKT